MENGYHASFQMTSDSFNTFQRKTGFSKSDARRIYLNAKGAASETASKFGAIVEQAKNPLRDTPTDNTSIEINHYLRRLNGYSELFGSQDYCKCLHCQSIYSPAAYFVDLMDFIKKYVIDEHFDSPFETDDIRYYLDLRIRRPNRCPGRF